MPAAAVIRRLQTLSGIIGRKEMRRRFGKFLVKAPSSTGKLLGKLSKSSREKVIRILGGVVKCVDTKRNTNGEGNSLVLKHIFK